MIKAIRINPLYALIASCFMLLGFSVLANAETKTYNDFTQFTAQTGATSVTGVIPDLGAIPGDAFGSQTLGSATFTISAPSSRLFIGPYSSLIPGNVFAISDVENLNVDLASPVYSFGFYFAEPTDQNACGGGAPQPCVDSSFQVLLKDNSTIVGTLNFNATDDVLNFLGVTSDQAFNRVEIKDLTANKDNEYFGEFFANTVPPIRRDLVVINAGGGHIVGTGIDCQLDCGEQYFNDEIVILTAFPTAGYQLIGWESCDNIDGLQCTMNMSGDKTVTAIFEQISHELNVSISGEGLVTGTGIFCPTECTEKFIEGQSIILVASVPPGSDSTFRNWVNCDAPAGDECRMTMDSNKNVTANFASLSGARITSQQKNAQNPNAIPTLSEWALILLAALLVVIASIRFYRPHKN